MRRCGSRCGFARRVDDTVMERCTRFIFSAYILRMIMGQVDIEPIFSRDCVPTTGQCMQRYTMGPFIVS